MFFDRFRDLCDQKGISTYKAATEIGLNRGAVNKWKNGSVPNGQTLAKMAEFFGVTTDYLLGDSEQKEKPLINGDEELTEYLELLKTRPEMRMLFQISKDATKEDVEKAVRIIEALRNK